MKLQSLRLLALSAVLLNRTNAGLALQDTPCSSTGIDYFGYDVDKIFTGPATESAANCQKACQQNAKCSFWTFTRLRRHCFLKDGRAPSGAVKNRLAVSGPRECPYDGCYEANTDYNGYDVIKIEDGSVPTPQKCHSACLASPRCSYWTFIPSTRNCSLKSHYAPRGKVAHREAISGPRQCAPPHDSTGCYEENTDFLGYDLQVANGVGSATQCHATCRVSSECKFWTWVPTTRSCNLKSEYAPLGRVYAPGIVSGPRSCAESPHFPPPHFPPVGPHPPPPPPPDGCPPGLPCPFPSTSTSRSAPQLHTSLPVTTISTTFTTQTTTVSPSTTTEKCLVRKILFSAGTIGRSLQPSVAACRSVCRANERCQYFSYRKEFKLCVLKSGVGPETLIPEDQTVSGHRDCLENDPQDLPQGTWPPPLPPSMASNTEYLGTVVDSMAGVLSAEHCKILCLVTSGCEFFVFRDSHCLLKQGLEGRIRSRGFVSGEVIDPNQATAISKCAVQGQRYQDVPGDSTPFTGEVSLNALSCMKSCQAESGSDDTDPTPPGGSGGDTDPTPPGGSGGDTDPTPPGGSRGDHPGRVAVRDWSGQYTDMVPPVVRRLADADLVPGWSVSDGSDPVVPCKAFSYNTATRMCFKLRAKSPLTPDDNFVSGVSKCVADQPTPPPHDVVPGESCMKSQKYIGFAVKPPFFAQTIGQCQKACLGYKYCKFFTYRKDNKVCILLRSAVNQSPSTEFESGSSKCTP
ncbi:microneme protein [Cystoisospora suis]|uniref:Microneme protein n=1 Tax=Cystoisospora suis TaxID=483139 RepID=A0A2C6L490_9APIC|nr:microneme protein [Cystoisospora suis]